MSETLNLAPQRNSPARSTKSTRSHLSLAGVVLSLLVSIRFQVLFHSPPGVLFTFPSRYYTLSVTKSYLALGDGPPLFPPNFSCSTVLRIITRYNNRFAYGAFTLSGAVSHSSFNYSCYVLFVSPKPQTIFIAWFRLLRVRSPLLTQSLFYFLFLRVIRCFSSPGSPATHYLFMRAYSMFP